MKYQRLTSILSPIAVATVLLAIVVAGSASAADEDSAVAKIEELGGAVRAIAQNSDDKEIAFHLSGTDLTNEGLKHVKEVPNVVWLNLRGTQITNEGLQHLSELESLTRLHLELTDISDMGLAHLSGLKNLKYLNLYGTNVTDAGLTHLEELNNLEKLYLWKTKVTKEGAAKLAKSLPDLYINRGADAEPGPPTKALAMGRYVKVRLEGEERILQLAEVEVIETATGKVLQTSGTASQSSTYDEAVAGRANDGDTDGSFSNESVSHTTEEENPWWLLDLGDTQDIGKIVVHNRADCCGDRLKGAIVEVFDRALTVVWTGKIEEASDGSQTAFEADATEDD